MFMISTDVLLKLYNFVQLTAKPGKIVLRITLKLIAFFEEFLLPINCYYFRWITKKSLI